MVAKVDKIFSSYQPCQLVKNYGHFRDHLCPNYQGLMSHQIPMMVPEMLVIFNQLTRLRAQEYFMNQTCSIQLVVEGNAIKKFGWKTCYKYTKETETYLGSKDKVVCVCEHHNMKLYW
jgi:hypothetical protein